MNKKEQVASSLDYFVTETVYMWATLDETSTETQRLGNYAVSSSSRDEMNELVSAWLESRKDINHVIIDFKDREINKIVYNGESYNVLFAPEEIDLMCRPNTVVFIKNIDLLDYKYHEDLSDLYIRKEVADPRVEGFPYTEVPDVFMIISSSDIVNNGSLIKPVLSNAIWDCIQKYVLIEEI